MPEVKEASILSDKWSQFSICMPEKLKSIHVNFGYTIYHKLSEKASFFLSLTDYSAKAMQV